MWTWILCSIPSSPGSFAMVFVTLQGNRATCLSAAMNPAESSEEWNYILDGGLGCSHVTKYWLKFPLVFAFTLAPISGNTVGGNSTEKSAEAVGILASVSSCCVQLNDTALQIL